MKCYREPSSIVTDYLKSYRAAMKVNGNIRRSAVWALAQQSSRKFTSAVPTTEGLARFRDIKSRRKFVSVHACVHNHFNRDRHLNSRDIFKQKRTATLAKWYQRAV